jgi:hypothetical protein
MIPTAAVRLAVLLAASTAGACVGLRHLDAGIGELRDIVRRQDCRDGAPARVLVDPRCVDGICGVTCAPGRWTAATLPNPTRLP